MFCSCFVITVLLNNQEIAQKVMKTKDNHDFNRIQDLFPKQRSQTQLWEEACEEVVLLGNTEKVYIDKSIFKVTACFNVRAYCSSSKLGS